MSEALRYRIYFAHPDRWASFELALSRELVAQVGEYRAVARAALEQVGFRAATFDESRPSEVFRAWGSRVERIDRNAGDGWVRGWRWPVPATMATVATGEIPVSLRVRAWPE